MDSLADLEQKNINRAATLFEGLEPQGKGIIETLARLRAAIEYSSQGMIEWHMRQLFPDSAEDEQLDRLLAWRGIQRHFGNKAQGTAQVRGRIGSVVPTGATIRTQKGQRYQVTSETKLSHNLQEIKIEAIENGVDANGENIVAEFEAAIIGMQPGLTLNATAGTDDEGDEAFRLRALEIVKNRGTLYGKVGDYAIWALSASAEVAHAFEVPNFENTGALGLLVFSGSYASVSAGALTNVATYIEGVKQAGVGFKVVQGEVKYFDFTLSITPGTTALRSAVQDALYTRIKQNERPEAHISLASLKDYIEANVKGLTSLAILSPVTTLTCSQRQVPLLGDITWP